eukprot:COSAG05_NODE_1731_length_4186_cov_471.477857_2_plen_199_part_00
MDGYSRTIAQGSKLAQFMVVHCGATRVQIVTSGVADDSIVPCAGDVEQQRHTVVISYVSAGIVDAYNRAWDLLSCTRRFVDLLPSKRAFLGRHNVIHQLLFELSEVRQSAGAPDMRLIGTDIEHHVGEEGKELIIDGLEDGECLPRGIVIDLRLGRARWRRRAAEGEAAALEWQQAKVNANGLFLPGLLRAPPRELLL